MSISIFPVNREQARLFSNTIAQPTAGQGGLTRFFEVSVDSNWEQKFRAIIKSEPDDLFRSRFSGRLPSPEEKQACIEDWIQTLVPVRAYENNVYRVEIQRTPLHMADFVHLSIRRHDREACHNWAHLQWIKNEIVGPDHEAVELFPAESRLVDTANEYHLWVHVEPHFRFPIGWTARHVLRESNKVA